MFKSNVYLNKKNMDEPFIDYEMADEAKNLLQNGILVETSKGLICMSLNDALSSDLNLSVEDLQNVATKLILEQSPLPPPKKSFLKSTNINFDSDGFSSECSDVSAASSSTIHQNLNDNICNNTNDIKTMLSIDETKPIKIILNNNNNNNNNNNTNNNNVKDNNDESNTNNITVIVDNKPPKRRGGWPKGRKRKPELLNLPPKAPATGYNLYLSEQRKLFKDSTLVFHEITKVIGNKWSSLSLEEKKPYLARADEDKKRYKEELKQYRQSDAYRAYLAKKRKNKLQNNILSESDMDATDDLEDEDNEELYCRTCDQWFHNLHNKREHLQGRQHTQSVAGDIKKELNTSYCLNSLDESSLDAMPSKMSKLKQTNLSVSDTIVNLIGAVNKRENEITLIKNKLNQTISEQEILQNQLNNLLQKESKLKNDMENLKEQERDMESKVFNLWQVPSWFIITDFNKETKTNDFNQSSS